MRQSSPGVVGVVRVVKDELMNKRRYVHFGITTAAIAFAVLAFAPVTAHAGTTIGGCSSPTGGMVTDVVTATLWVSCNDNPGKVVEIDPVTKAVITTVLLNAGTVPEGIAIDGTNENIWVADNFNNQVIKVSTVSKTIVGTFRVGNTPVDVVYDRPNDTMWVGGSDASMFVLRSSDGVLLKAIGAGNVMNKIAHLLHVGKYIFANDGVDVVTYWNASTYALQNRFSEAANTGAMSADTSGNVWFPGCCSINEITYDVTTAEYGPTNTYYTASGGTDLLWHGSLMYLTGTDLQTTLLLINSTTYLITKTIQMPSEPLKVVILGGHAFVACTTGVIEE